MTRPQPAAILILLVLLTASLAPAITAQAPQRPLGCLFTEPQPHLLRLPPRDGAQTTPTELTVDLSADLPPVGNQGAQPSCVAWATAYYFKTYQEKRERGSLTPLSPAYAFNQIYIAYSGGVAAYVGDALDLLVNQGCAPWDQFPYQDNDYQTQPTYEQRRYALPYQSADYGAFFLSNLGDPRTPTLANNDLLPLKAQLAGGEPVVLVLPIYAEFDAPAGPHAIVDVPANTLTFRGGHAILLVGYDDAIGGFKFVN
ncbi:MAG: C1 family peptidase, partial [Chloroflexi bacterium]|nr:C1 family peptidase [Chloroflexota bacterium]